MRNASDHKFVWKLIKRFFVRANEKSFVWKFVKLINYYNKFFEKFQTCSARLNVIAKSLFHHQQEHFPYKAR